MNFCNAENGQLVTKAEILAAIKMAHPNKSVPLSFSKPIPSMFKRYGFAIVREADPPTLPHPLATATLGEPEYVNGEWRQSWEVNMPSNEKAKAWKLEEINNKAEDLLAQLDAGYPEREVKGWYKQEQQARACKAGETDTAMLDAAALERGVTREEMADLILAKVNVYEGMYGAIIGKRQRLESDVEALDAESETFLDDLALISWGEA